MITGFVDTTQLIIYVPPNLTQTPGNATVSVINPGGTMSNTVSFVVGATPPPVITRLDPPELDVGSDPTVTVHGSGFSPQSSVKFNGQDPLSSTYLDPARMSARIGFLQTQEPSNGVFTVVNPGGLVSNAATLRILLPPPTYTGFVPNKVIAGGPAFELHVWGLWFTAGSIVRWNDAPLATRYVHSGLLNVTVPASLITTPGTSLLKVVRPDGRETFFYGYTIDPPSPIITGLLPNSVTAGGAGFTLTLNGSGFGSGSTVLWNGSALPTALLSSTQLTAVVAAGLIATAGTASIGVASSGGTISPPVSFSITSAPAPTISSLSPSSATSGGGILTLTVDGTGFIAGSTVRWNGIAVPTTVVSNTRLTASIAANLTALVTSASISVMIPTGLSSSAVPFVINPPGCNFSLNLSSATASAAGDRGRVDVTASALVCRWTATTNVDWITVDPGYTGLGTDTVTYTVAQQAIPGVRTGALTIGGRNLQITQSGNSLSPTLLVGPATLSLRIREGTEAQAKSVYVLSNGAGFPFTATAAGGSWLSLRAASGRAPVALQVIANPVGLSPGSYEGTVTVSADTATPVSRTLPVTLTVDAFEPSQLNVEPEAIVIAVPEQAPPAKRVLHVSNRGRGDLPFTATASTSLGGNWLAAATSNQATVVVTANPTGLRAGTYTGRVVLAAPTGSSNIPVSMTITPGQRPAIGLSQSGLAFVTVADSGDSAQSLAILNTGTGVLNWTSSASTSPGSGNWLTVTPDGGAADASAPRVPRSEVRVRSTGLAPGLYEGQVQVSAPGADNSPQFVTVRLTVLPVGSNAEPIVSPEGIIFSSVEGSSPPASQLVTARGRATRASSFRSFRNLSDTQDWFVQEPVEGSVDASRAAQITVQPLTSGLAPGIRKGELALMFPGGDARVVSLVSLLLPRSAAGAAASCSATQLHVVFVSAGSDSSVRAGGAVPIEVDVMDDCGRALSKGDVIASFSNSDKAIALTSLKDGHWSGTWYPRSEMPSNGQITVRAYDPDTLAQGQAAISRSIRPNPGSPVISARGIVSAAAPSVYSVPLAVGGFVSIYGSNLAKELCVARSLPLPKEICETSVLLGARLLPLQFVSTTQINAIVPYDLPQNSSQQLIVRRGAQWSMPETVAIASAQPSIFALNQQGTGQGAIVEATSGALAGLQAPVTPGQIVSIFCTGLGDVTPPVLAGEAAPAATLSRTVNEVGVLFDSVPAAVLFAGLTPGFFGLYQVNAEVPHALTSSDSVKVIVTAAGIPSPPVTMAVR